MSKKIFLYAAIIISIALGVIFLKNKQASAPGRTEQTNPPENTGGNQPSMNTGTSPAPAPAPLPGPTPQPTTPQPAPAPSPAPTPAPAAVSVSIQNFKFNPDQITVKKGTTVTWTNNDSAPHTVTVDQGSGPASGTLNQGDNYSYTFDTTGTFDYHCAFHPFMRGVIAVTE